MDSTESFTFFVPTTMQTVAEMEGITHGIRPEAVVTKVRDKDGKVIREEKKLKYKIKTRYGLIPVYEKKEEKKSE